MASPKASKSQANHLCPERHTSNCRRTPIERCYCHDRRIDVKEIAIESPKLSQCYSGVQSTGCLFNSLRSLLHYVFGDRYVVVPASATGSRQLGAFPTRHSIWTWRKTPCLQRISSRLCLSLSPIFPFKHHSEANLRWTRRHAPLRLFAERLQNPTSPTSLYSHYDYMPPSRTGEDRGLEVMLANSLQIRQRAQRRKRSWLTPMGSTYL